MVDIYVACNDNLITFSLIYILHYELLLVYVVFLTLNTMHDHNESNLFQPM